MNQYHARQDRLDAALLNAIPLLEKLAHDKGAVALLDAHIGRFFEYTPNPVFKTPYLFSLSESIKSGALKKGFLVRAVVDDKANGFGISGVKLKTDFLPRSAYDLVVYDRNREAKKRRRYVITAPSTSIDSISDEEAQKTMLHEISHATQEDQPFKRELELEAAEEKGIITSAECEALMQETRRNCELFCDGVADFAMTEFSYGGYRKKLFYHDRLQIKKREYSDANLPVSSQDIVSELELLQTKKDMLLQDDDRRLEEISHKEFEASDTHPSLRMFRKNSDMNITLARNYYAQKKLCR